MDTASTALVSVLVTCLEPARTVTSEPPTRANTS
jgi:hypothetical protein